MINTLKTTSPVDGSVFVERAYAKGNEFTSALVQARMRNRTFTAIFAGARAALALTDKRSPGTNRWIG